MTKFVIEMHDSYLTVAREKWAWGHKSDAINFADVRSALRIRDIVETQPEWTDKCSVQEIDKQRPLNSEEKTSG